MANAVIIPEKMSDPDQAEKERWKDLRITNQKIVCKKGVSRCKLEMSGLTSPFVQGIVREWDYLHDYSDASLPRVQDEAIAYARLEKAIGHTRYRRLHARSSEEQRQSAAALAAAVEMKEVLFSVSEDGAGTDTLVTIADLLAIERLVRKKRKTSPKAIVQTYDTALDNVEASLNCELGVPVQSRGIQDRLPNCYYHAALNSMLSTMSTTDRESIIKALPNKYHIKLGNIDIKSRGPTTAEMHFLSKGGRVNAEGGIDFEYLWAPILEVAYAQYLIQTLSKDPRLSSYQPSVNKGEGSPILQALTHTPVNLGAALAIYALKGSSSTMYLKDMSNPAITNFRRHKRQKDSLPFAMKKEPSTEAFQSAISMACTKGKIVVLGTDVETSGLKKNDHAGDHAFAVYDLYESGGKKYLRVYNPHGYNDSVEFSEAVGKMQSVTIED
jgi:hypothetical protein